MRRPLRPCSVPACPNLTASRRTCREHAARHAAVYDRAWQMFAAGYLRRHPLCEHCRHAPAREVHHPDSIALVPHRRLDPLNAMALCHGCHRALTPRGAHTS